MLETDVINNSMCLYSTAFLVSVNYEALKLLAMKACENDRIFGFNIADEYHLKEYKSQVFEMI